MLLFSALQSNNKFGLRGTILSRILSQRWFKRLAGLVVTLLAVTLACASYFRVWGWRDMMAYQGMSRECHPVWRELHWDRIRAGQDVEQVIAETQPARVERYGEFVQLSYQQGLSFTGVTITAKNGRLASAGAWSCTWNRVFFDELSRDDWKAYSVAYEAHWQPIRQKRSEAEPVVAPDRSDDERDGKSVGGG